MRMQTRTNWHVEGIPALQTRRPRRHCASSKAYVKNLSTFLPGSVFVRRIAQVQVESCLTYDRQPLKKRSHAFGEVDRALANLSRNKEKSERHFQ